MENYKIKTIEDKNNWENFLLSQNPQSFLQSWNWGETNKIVGNKIIRLGFYSRNHLVGVCLAIIEKAKRGSYILIPGGPILDWNNKKIVSLLIKKLKNVAKEEGVCFIRIRPELPNSEGNKKLFSKLGFLSAPMHLHAENTWVLDISPSEEEILAGMRKNTRSSVKKSLNFGLSIRKSINTSDSKILMNLQKQTVKRHQFVGFSEKLFKAQLETFGKDSQVCLFVCQKEKAPLVAAIIIFYGEYAYYHHSGSSDQARNVPASYFLQWEVIKEAKRRGCKYYNFWGIAPSDDPKHRFYGVSIFKKGFGGMRVDWLHAQDLQISPWYYLTYVFETFRKIIRRL